MYPTFLVFNCFFPQFIFPALHTGILGISYEKSAEKIELKHKVTVTLLFNEDSKENQMNIALLCSPAEDSYAAWQCHIHSHCLNEDMGSVLTAHHHLEPIVANYMKSHTSWYIFQFPMGLFVILQICLWLMHTRTIRQWCIQGLDPHSFCLSLQSFQTICKTPMWQWLNSARAWTHPSASLSSMHSFTPAQTSSCTLTRLPTSLLLYMNSIQTHLEHLDSSFCNHSFDYICGVRSVVAEQLSRRVLNPSVYIKSFKTGECWKRLQIGFVDGLYHSACRDNRHNVESSTIHKTDASAYRMRDCCCLSESSG